MHRIDPDRLVAALSRTVVTFVVVLLCLGVPMAAAGCDVPVCLSATVLVTALLAWAYAQVDKRP